MIEEGCSTVSVQIMDRAYKVKCPSEKTPELHESALYLDDKMRNVMKEGQVLSPDRIAVIAALNIAHELLMQQKQKNFYIERMSKRINELQRKIDKVLATR